MALRPCKECGAQVSTAAKACPSCGAPPRAGTSVGTIVVAVLLLFGMASAVSTCSSSEPSPSAAKPPPDPVREKQFQTAVAGAKWLKSKMKNPASFELVAVTMIGDLQAMCYEYRGTNSFNAIVTSRHVITDNVNSGEARDWNKHCAGKSGTDFSYARHAL